jgi:hypothetical protein
VVHAPALVKEPVAHDCNQVLADQLVQPGIQRDIGRGQRSAADDDMKQMLAGLTASRNCCNKPTLPRPTRKKTPCCPWAQCPCW